MRNDTSAVVRVYTCDCAGCREQTTWVSTQDDDDRTLLVLSGWAVQDGKHYCQTHRTHPRNSFQRGALSVAPPLEN